MVAGHLQVKKGMYYVVLNLKSPDGKRIPKWVSTGIHVGGKKEEKQAFEKLIEFRHTYRDPVVLDPEVAGVQLDPNIRFSDFMLFWLESVKNSVEGDTYAGYEANVKARIVP